MVRGRFKKSTENNKKLAFIAWQDVFSGANSNLWSIDEVSHVVRTGFQDRQHLTGTMGCRGVTHALCNVLAEGWMDPNSQPRKDFGHLFPATITTFQNSASMPLEEDFPSPQVEEDDMEDSDELNEGELSEYEDFGSGGGSEGEGAGRMEIQSDVGEEKGETLVYDELEEDTVQKLREADDAWNQKTSLHKGEGSGLDNVSDQENAQIHQVMQPELSNHSILCKVSVVKYLGGDRIRTNISGNLMAQPQIEQASRSSPYPEPRPPQTLSSTEDKNGAMKVNRLDLSFTNLEKHNGRTYKRLLQGYAMPTNPTYLPFKLQHAVLTSTQKLLEECCFHFAKKWVPSFLRAKGWEIPEAGELNQYPGLFTHDVPAAAISQDFAITAYLTPSKVLGRLTNVRHCAVHRVAKVPIVTIGNMIKDSVALASLFGDHDRLAQLKHWHSTLESLVVNLDVNLNARLEGIGDEIRGIQDRKAVLAREQAELEEKEKVLRESLKALGSTHEDIDPVALSILNETFGVSEDPVIFRHNPDLPDMLDDAPIVDLKEICTHANLVADLTRNKRKAASPMPETPAPGNTSSSSVTRPQKRARSGTSPLSTPRVTTRAMAAKLEETNHEPLDESLEM